MLIPRVMPCLLLHNEMFVKTTNFKKPCYIGDPVNVINLFNRFEVDEIILLDIRATKERRKPPLELLEQMAEECWVPLTYGGGINEIADIRRIMEIGVEKVVLNSIAASNPAFVTEVTDRFGSQAVVVSVDVKEKMFGGYEVFAESGTRRLRIDPVTYAQKVEQLGAGEVLLYSIDRDGTMGGFDLELIRAVSGAVNIPLIACGGAGDRADLAAAIQQGKAHAVAAGCIFVYQNRERGVLVNFPERDKLEKLLN